MATITLRSTKGSPLTNNEVDGNFTNLNNDKYESGDSVSFVDVTSTGEITLSTTAAVTAAGTVQGDATALTTTYSIVTTATADQGVVLPDAATGKVAKVINATAVNIKVYPASAEQIDSLGTNVAKNLAPGASLEVVAASGSSWKSLLPVVIFDSSGTQLN
jgi:hypothetical protein